MCSHFNIKDGREYTTFSAYYALLLSKRLKMQLKCKKKICAVYRESAVADGTCQKLFVKFHSEDFLLNNVPRMSRPVEVDGDQIETLIKNH